MRDKFAPEITLEQIAERLVCKTCGSRDGSLTILQDPTSRQGGDMTAPGFYRG